MSILARALQQLSSGGIEIDLLNATPGAGLIQRKRTYATGATLSYYDLMQVIRYDSSSGGTLTLPPCIPQFDGAVIDFEQLGTGLLTIGDPVTGTLVSSPNTTGNRALAGRYATARATCRGNEGVWILSGALS